MLKAMINGLKELILSRMVQIVRVITVGTVMISSTVLIGMDDAEWTDEDQRAFEEFEREEIDEKKRQEDEKREQKRIHKNRIVHQRETLFERQNAQKNTEKLSHEKKLVDKVNNQIQRNKEVIEKKEQTLKKIDDKNEELNKKRKREAETLANAKNKLAEKKTKQQELINHLKTHALKQHQLLQQGRIYGDLYPMRPLKLKNESPQAVYVKWYFLDKHNQKLIAADKKGAVIIRKDKSYNTNTPLAYVHEHMYSLFIPYPIFSCDSKVLTNEIDLNTVRRTTSSYRNGWSYYWGISFLGRINYNGKIGNAIIHMRDFTRSHLKEGKDTYRIVYDDPKNSETLTLISE